MTYVEQILSCPCVHRLGWALVHSLWEMALVGLLVAWLLGVLHRRSANLRYLVRIQIRPEAAVSGVLLEGGKPAVNAGVTVWRPKSPVTGIEETLERELKGERSLRP